MASRARHDALGNRYGISSAAPSKVLNDTIAAGATSEENMVGRHGEKRLFSRRRLSWLPRKEGMQSPVIVLAVLLICIGRFAFFAVLLPLV